MAKNAKRSEASKKAAETREANRMKKLIGEAKVDLIKYQSLGNTPEERREAARNAKIAEIQQRQKDETEAKAASRSNAAKQASETRRNVKRFKLDGQLRSLVSQIREVSDDEAVELLRKFLDK